MAVGGGGGLTCDEKGGDGKGGRPDEGRMPHYADGWTTGGRWKASATREEAAAKWEEVGVTTQ